MAKKIIKGNNWQKQNWQGLINRILPVVCAAFALFCIAGSIMMGQSESNIADNAVVENVVSSQKTYVAEEPDSNEATKRGVEHDMVEETALNAETDEAEEGKEVEETDTEKTTSPTDRTEISEEIYTAQETVISADNKAEETSDKSGSDNLVVKPDNSENTEEELTEVVSYEISNEVENAELIGKTNVKESAMYTATLKAAEGYMLPKSISVIMDSEGTEVNNVFYDPETGKLQIPAGAIKGDLTLSGSAELILYYSVTSKINNSILYGSSADSQNGYTASIVPNAGYSLPVAITATSDGEPFTDFTYNASTGKIAVAPSAIKGNLVFDGESAPSIQAGKYQIIASIGHGKAEIKKDSTASAMEVVIVPDEGYECPKELIVISGGRRFTDLTYDDESGKLTIGYGKVSRVIISGVCTDTKAIVKYLGERSAIPKSGEEGSLSGTAENPFVDVKEEDYFYDAVIWATQKGIVSGADPQHFAPYDPVSRSQVVTLLWRAAGCPESNANTDSFTDLFAGEYYIKPIAWAIEQGIAKGITETTFEPETVCTRGQIVTFLARFAGVEEVETVSVFADVPATEFFAAAVKWAKDNGIIGSESSKIFEPYAPCCRADVVMFLYRYMTK